MSFLQKSIKTKNLERSGIPGNAYLKCTTNLIKNDKKKQKDELESMSDAAIQEKYERKMREAQKMADSLNGETKTVKLGDERGFSPSPSSVLFAEMNRDRFVLQDGSAVQLLHKPIRNGSSVPMFQICIQSTKTSMKNGMKIIFYFILFYLIILFYFMNIELYK